MLYFPLENMKKLIKYMKNLFEMIEKNKTLIINKKLHPLKQIFLFSTGLYIDDDRILFISICVTAIYTSMVGIHEKIAGTTNDPTDIYFTLDSLNKLAIAINEIKKKVE